MIIILTATVLNEQPSSVVTFVRSYGEPFRITPLMGRLLTLILLRETWRIQTRRHDITLFANLIGLKVYRRSTLLSTKNPTTTALTGPFPISLSIYRV